RPLRRRRRLGAGSPLPFQPLAGPVELWRSQAFEAQPLAGAGAERLRGFHGHYGEDVLAAARAGDPDGPARMFAAWIERNPPRPDDAWHPYTISTRAGNWIAALSLLPELETPAVRDSLWRQLAVLARNVEDDVLGNHVIRNARALVLGGAAFGSNALLERGVELLERELPAQILPDGGHYERSPVYHLVVLRDLLEIAAATDVPGLDGAVARMWRFASALARPDGAPALFNDGGLDLAPALDLAAPDDGLSVFPETGYAVVRTRRLWLAFDCGAPSPPFLPAHAHADALSFQLWLDGRPVVVDPGTFTYEPGPDRDWFRGTRAHSTVAVDGDQFELWGAFRSGPLPRVELLEATERALVAAVTGRTGVRHERRIELDGAELLIRDRLEGRGRRLVESSLPLAPGADPDATATGADATVTEQRPLSERFFERVEAPALVVREERSLPVELGWRIGLG
ncbi:MAG: heparinase II/III domain-containing protein, partial [Gaiellaceae bacterium]